MGFTYKEVAENGLLSEEVLACIPEKCECGADIEFTGTLRQIYCSGPRCLYKIAARLEAMAKAMKVDGWGESTCITVCREFGLKSPYQVFLLEKEIEKGRTSSVAAFDKKVAAICDREKRKVELWEVVRLGGIPGIETTAYKIFDGYDSIKEAYEDIEKGQVPFIAERLGIKNSEASVMAMRVYNTLMEYRMELEFAETQFDIYKPTGRTIRIAITGGVDGFRNKSEYIKYINNRYNGNINAMLMSSVTQQVDVLVADGGTSSNKYKTALRVNERYIEKGLRTGQFTEDEIGVLKDKRDLHRIGEKILITDSTSLIHKLDDMFI